MAGRWKAKSSSGVKINYTRRGGMYIKPSDIAKSKDGKKLIRNNKNSKLAQSIRERD